MIFGPDGRALCEPVDVGEEAVLKAGIDLRDIDCAKTVRISQPLSFLGAFQNPCAFLTAKYGRADPTSACTHDWQILQGTRRILVAGLEESNASD